MKIFQEGIKLSKDNVNEIAEQILDYFLNNNKISGFGHRYHNEYPRAPRLMELSRKYNCFREHFKLAVAIENILLNEIRRHP